MQSKAPLEEEKRLKPKVAVVFSSPATVQDDIARAMHLADYQSHLAPKLDTLLKVNISWQYYYPACSTTPWQLEGVINTLLKDGYESLIAAHNGTVVVDSFEGEENNKQKVVQDKYGIPGGELKREASCQDDFKHGVPEIVMLTGLGSAPKLSPKIKILFSGSPRASNISEIRAVSMATPDNNPET